MRLPSSNQAFGERRAFPNVCSKLGARLRLRGRDAKHTGSLVGQTQFLRFFLSGRHEAPDCNQLRRENKAEAHSE
jgi:hypothetical protein